MEEKERETRQEGSGQGWWDGQGARQTGWDEIGWGQDGAHKAELKEGASKMRWER